MFVCSINNFVDVFIFGFVVGSAALIIGILLWAKFGDH